ncbi:MAG TPA: 50S ribosome-binding GTPase [Syntrophales bacterium]|nr:50S ribosome-binding GTPase [Syntrophales bacterium]HPQ43181.1 50S ribosome-binding GTPase [Syntrophales bacterium]
MNDSSIRLRNSILEAQKIARTADLATLSPEERRRMVQEAQTLLDKLDVVTQQYLVVGLLGGTGVGKSTLMNVLAEASISSASHRRPHTDAILLYHHIDTPLPVQPDPGTPWREYTHTSRTAQQIVLCDLPDFDSIQPEHRRQVLDFIEHVDILVWLTSPAKYGDGSFYEFLQLVPKSKHNFYFVLNKSDLFFDGGNSGEGFKEMQRVHADFRGHLRKADIADPVIFTVSAEEALDGQALSPWNQAPSLRQEIFRQRDLKEIKNIKTANLDQEYSRYLSLFKNELVHLETMHDILTHTITAMEIAGAEEERIVRDNIYAALDESTRVEIRLKLENTAILKGPGYGMAALVEQWRYGRSKGRIDEEHGTFDLANRRMVQVIQRQLENITNRIMSDIMRRGAHRVMAGRVEDILKPEYRTRIFEEKLDKQANSRLTSSHSDRHILFQTGQYIVYLFLLSGLIVALAGKTAWQDLFANPSLNHMLNFIFTAFFNLFSPAGLAALGSYALINLLFGFWFYRRYRRLVERKTSRIIKSFVENTGRQWRESIGHTSAALKEYDQALVATAQSLRELK